MRRDQADRIVVGQGCSSQQSLICPSRGTVTSRHWSYGWPKETTKELPRDRPRDYQGTTKGRPRDNQGSCRCPFALLQAPRALIIAEFSEDFLCGQAAVRRMNCAPCRWNAAWSNTPRVPAWLSSPTPMCW